MLLVLCGTVFLEGLDVSMMGVALPSIRADLNLATSSLQWVVSAYVLGYGGFVLLGGRAADLLGRRRMFLAALVVFIAFSGLGGLAPAGWALILARFATGVSAGFLTPASLSIITTNFEEGEARNRALLVYGGAAAGGFSLGMVAGGLLASVDWRWVFFAPVLFALGLLVVAVRFLPHDEAPPMHRGGLDLAGRISLTSGMLLLVLGVVRSPDVAWEQTAATLVGGVTLLAVFVADRETIGVPAGPPRDPPIRPAGAGQPRRPVVRRVVRRIPVHHRALPSGAPGVVSALHRLGADGRRHRHGDRADRDSGARPPLRQRPGRARRHGSSVRRLCALPPAGGGLDVRHDAANVAPHRCVVRLRLRSVDDRRDRSHRRNRNRGSPVACSTPPCSSARPSSSPS